jgi:hypothetical protein
MSDLDNVDVNNDIILDGSMGDPEDIKTIAKYSTSGGKAQVQKFIRGAQRSRVRLAQLGFDPIERLVNMYDLLEKEHKYWLELRESGLSIVRLDTIGEPIKKKGKIRYSGVAHAAVLAQMAKVCNDLLRYSYGRVPDTLPNGGDKASPLVINLKPKGDRVPASQIILGASKDQEVEFSEYDTS